MRPYDAQNTRFRASAPTSQGVAVLGGSPYSYFRYESHLAAQRSLDIYGEIADEFETSFGRRHDAIDAYRCDDAEIVFVMLGSFSTKAMAAVDQLREAGRKVGLARIRLLRPFPTQALRSVVAGARGLAVIDQNLSMGMGGVLHSEVATALYGQSDAPPVLASFIGGLGGRDISPEELYEIASVTQRAAENGKCPPPRLLYTSEELREVRKLQAIAEVERNELESGR